MKFKEIVLRGLIIKKIMKNNKKSWILKMKLVNKIKLKKINNQKTWIND